MAILSDFQMKVHRLQVAALGANRTLNEQIAKIKSIRTTLFATPNANKELIENTKIIEAKLNDLNTCFNGDRTIANRNGGQAPTIMDRLEYSYYTIIQVTSDATETVKQNYKIASEMFDPALAQLKHIVEVDIMNLEKEMNKLNSPWTPGRLPDWKPE